MAFTNDTVSSLSNLIDKLNTWMAANGWTSEHLDLTTTAGTGGEWAMRRTSGATNIRFAASWDAAGTPGNLALYQYVDQNYVIADRPWGQDHDSGNGLAASSPNSSIINERHVVLGATPLRFWAYEDDHYTHVVVETSAGVFQHFGWGLLNKLGGDWVGGEYCYGQRNNLTNFSAAGATWDGMSLLLDGHLNDTGDFGGLFNGSELIAATIHCESMPNQPAGGMWGVSMGGTAASPQTDLGTDRQSNDGASSDVDRVLFTWGLRAGPFAQPFARLEGSDKSGHTPMWPVAVTYVNPSTTNIHGCPIGVMPDVKGINMLNWEAGDTILIGGDTWQVFPAQRKYPGSGSGVGYSGYLGIAYKQVS